jgi:tRNA (guanine-N(7)-)-methyltransferase subunit TRM82
MSKQLLHSCRSDAVVAALNDRAFALMMNSRDGDDGGGGAPSSARALELLPPPPPSSSSSSPSSVVVANATAMEDDIADGGEAAAGDDDDDAGRPKTASTPSSIENPLEIQAVCCHCHRASSGGAAAVAWIAVSREDKTLSLYSAPPSSSSPDDGRKRTDETMAVEEEEEEERGIRPTVTYHVPRRARCLAFATVPSSDDDGGDRLVVIAGDMSGDAWAFPVPSDDDAATAGSHSSSAPIRRRLLLGHTASILTGLSVVAPPRHRDDDDGGDGCGRGGGGGQSILLTADRDEKVRVSHFPDAHVVRGYLLGHAAFVSTMDAVAVPSDGDGDGRPTGGRTLCATGSGDGTVRLWDCKSCREVGMVPVAMDRRRPPTLASDDGAKGGGDGDDDDDDDDERTNGMDGAEEYEDEEDEEGGDDVEVSSRGDSDGGDDDDENCDEYDEPAAAVVAVPLSVALGPDAGCVIVARDGIPEIDVHPIPSSTSAPPGTSPSPFASLHEKQTLACASQPLSVRCLSDGSVLALVAGGPDGHLLHYRRNGGGSGIGSAHGPFEDVSSDSPFCASLRAALGSDVTDMPKSTLERDGCGGLKLQKTRVLDDHRGGGDDGGEDGGGGGSGGGGGGGLHWNDAGRREVAKLRLQRRRKRRRERGNTEKVDGGE